MASYRYEWNEAKRAANLAAHGLDFAELTDFDWERALILRDSRKSYGEARYIAYGLQGSRLHAVVFTPRGDARRIISFRKANRREQASYTDQLR